MSKQYVIALIITTENFHLKDNQLTQIVHHFNELPNIAEFMMAVNEVFIEGLSEELASALIEVAYHPGQAGDPDLLNSLSTLQLEENIYLSFYSI